MASRDEIRTSQANQYFLLLSLRAQNPGLDIKGLDLALNLTKAAMLEPEISWVEKQVADTFRED